MASPSRTCNEDEAGNHDESTTDGLLVSVSIQCQFWLTSEALDLAHFSARIPANIRPMISPTGEKSALRHVDTQVENIPLAPLDRPLCHAAVIEYFPVPSFSGTPYFSLNLGKA
jgi:hypothetical protein